MITYNSVRLDDHRVALCHSPSSLDAVVPVTLTARILQKQRDRLLLLLGVQGAVVPAIFSREKYKKVINLIITLLSDSAKLPLLSPKIQVLTWCERRPRWRRTSRKRGPGGRDRSDGRRSGSSASDSCKDSNSNYRLEITR